MARRTHRHRAQRCSAEGDGVNPFPTRQAAETYLARIPDLALREATRAKLGLEAEGLKSSPPVAHVPAQEKQVNGLVQSQVSKTSPPPLLSQTAQNPALSQAIRTFESARTPQISPADSVLTFTLPFPPSLNSIWRAALVPCKPKKPGAPPWAARILLSLEGRKYRRAVRDVIRALNSPTTPPGARLALHLHACVPDRRARDLSNLPKALEDALTHAGVWADDSLIDELRVTRGPVVPGGQVQVTITPLTSTLFGGPP
ncbi:RusA family crossover junction endodeoxyribonuclease [Deinococcus sp. HMF7604]|uniref:RusA family crossover junction endodeoxyribonuclease n=1 Tax=Deinococcus betulae TaxID=2873312 RepID=UPI001CCA9C1A|nr:RusA family crossover junction endodeoxyribonuclease [Deinococcus betulae]MBZ9752744.1 RusA family crossover junction endodeoxyribonuclease [Deinococcus betulae]